MPLQSSGAISLSEIAGEFGGSVPHSLSEYYSAASGVPASGAISFSDFYGTSAGYQGNTVSLTSGSNDTKNPTQFGYYLSQYGSLSDTTTFLDIYGTNAHRVERLYQDTTTQKLYLYITGSATVSNDTWTSIAWGAQTFNRSAGTFTQPGGSTTGMWQWSSSYSPSGTITWS